MKENSPNIVLFAQDPEKSSFIRDVLSGQQYHVLDSQTSDRAIKYIEDEDVSLVISVLDHNSSAGFALCERIREDETYHSVPFLFLGVNETEEDVRKSQLLGGDYYAPDEFSKEEFLQKVQVLLQRKELFNRYAEDTIEKTAPPVEKAKILLIDDDLSLGHLFQYNLKKEGFECRFVDNAKDSIKLAADYNPDVIVSDIMMPEMDGFELRQKILEIPELKRIPFIFLTAKGSEDDILQGYELEITDYVVKTSGPRVVIAKIKALLNSLGKERQKAVSELHQAANALRVKVVPDDIPEFSGFTIKQWHQSFRDIPGGDFIDYFKLDDNRLAIILGDVMGKKWGAWYFAVAYAGYIRSAIRMVLKNSTDHSPCSIMNEVNSSIYQDTKISEVFATLSILVLDNNKKTVQYSGAGDLPLFYYSREKGKAEMVVSDGMLLGFDSSSTYENKELSLSKGDTVCLITDGIIESTDFDGKQLGTETFEQLLNNISGAQDKMTYLKAEYTKRTGSAFEDDLSLILVEAD